MPYSYGRQEVAMANQSLKKRIGKNLQACRKAHGYKNAGLFAREIGMKESAYVEYEQGRVSLPLDKAWEFADVLDCTIDELVGRKVTRPAFSDPRQEQLNGCYESLNEESKTDVANMVKSIAADPARRIEKDGECLSNPQDVGQIA